ncbi:non-hydrolyzing UDP-N-acetylglucosamine 2-epimerase [Polaribacter dokdonensis]|uniref:UDP-N-acetylglucosamine 2-epimerase n=1 Tax=Polaribacter dokdonensis DSW-5 TaxID=1300348 RepID=A0A0N0CEJ8_9FLAO|nr:UDP-N-acetylglucosamine 2-epimerase (non-hydrolyzing) [Polaribacter dokdonensis]KOY50528.1 UDP-N-acetylglucosamine 2-epimerase [Polaribacter dokdonensis DSW-5]SEE60271.1 UDP-N-acetylglucosamine 2-epimerase (non-hydrolysing) [Polaribacter dokdonensis DSW-5]
MTKKILIVVGTRPNFVKITQFKKVAKNFPDLEVKIAHTGQHYDQRMSAVFLEQFNIEVDYFLGVSATSANSLIGEIIIALESVINNYKPDILLCVGDVNSTLAAAISANKLGVKLGHLESGLRSLDRQMPEEVNRILTDEITDICFVTEKSGIENLKQIGKKDNQIAFVGNTMIDTLVHFNKEIEASTIIEETGLETQDYILVTMHRPRNVDTKEALLKILDLFKNITKNHTVVFSIHPRTKNSFEKFNLYDDLKNINQLRIIDPQNYFAFQKLIKYSFCVITDSGGIQEETTFLKIPCITLRENTERPSTLEEGTNVLMTFNTKEISNKISSIINGTFKNGKVPKFWDGNATKRVLETIQNL